MRLRRKLSTALMALALGTGVTAVAASTAQPANASSSACLATGPTCGYEENQLSQDWTANNSNNPGTGVAILAGNHSGTASSQDFIRTGSNPYRYEYAPNGVGSGYCVTDPNTSPYAIVERPCSASNLQLFTAGQIAFGGYRLVNVASGLGITSHGVGAQLTDTTVNTNNTAFWGWHGGTIVTGAPTVTTNAATAVTDTTVTLNGSVNPDGLVTTYQFEYGTTTSYGSTIPATAGSAGSGNTSVNESASPTDLTASTQYHYRLNATNSAGTTHGADQTFTTNAANSTAPAMPTTVPSGFTRSFSEDFNSPAPVGSFDSVYGSQFGEYSGCCSTNGITQYSSAKVLSANNGSMFYNLHSENGTSYAAAPQVGNYQAFTYGQVGMSVKLDSSTGPGYKIAFLLWPSSNQWTNEVDFPEVDPDFTAPIRAVSLNTTTPNGSHTFCGPLDTGYHLNDGKYHTFLLTWTPGSMSASIDGTVVENFPASCIPSQPMRISLQAEGWINQGSVPASTTDVLEVPYVYLNTYNG